MMEARKVQKVGYSTLIVSLPKHWVEEVGLKQGDIVSFRREPDGGITIYPGLTHEPETYRYLAEEGLNMEEEADRIYWMIIRQLLLAVTDRRVAKEVGIEGPIHVVGNRIIAKSLEQMADLAAHVAQEALRLKSEAKKADPKLVQSVVDYSEKAKRLIEDAFNALMKSDLKKSNECIERAHESEQLERSLTADVMRSVKEVNVAVGLRAIIWDIGQMAKYSEAIAEVAVNRFMEYQNDFCAWEKVESHDTKNVTSPRMDKPLLKTQH